MDESTEARLTLKRDFAAFLDSDGGHGEYAARVAALLGAPGGVPVRGARLDVDLQVSRKRRGGGGAQWRGGGERRRKKKKKAMRRRGGDRAPRCEAFPCSNLASLPRHG